MWLSEGFFFLAIFPQNGQKSLDTSPSEKDTKSGVSWRREGSGRMQNKYRRNEKEERERRGKNKRLRNLLFLCRSNIVYIYIYYIGPPRTLKEA